MCITISMKVKRHRGGKYVQTKSHKSSFPLTSVVRHQHVITECTQYLKTQSAYLSSERLLRLLHHICKWLMRLCRRSLTFATPTRWVAALLEWCINTWTNKLVFEKIKKQNTRLAGWRVYYLLHQEPAITHMNYLSDLEPVFPWRYMKTGLPSLKLLWYHAKSFPCASFHWRSGTVCLKQFKTMQPFRDTPED